MLHDQSVFIIGQLGRFVPYLIRDTDFTDVVQGDSFFQIIDVSICPAELSGELCGILCYAQRVAAGVGILGLDRGGKGLNHLQVHVFCLLSAAQNFRFPALLFHILHVFYGADDVDEEQDEHARADEQSGDEYDIIDRNGFNEYAEDRQEQAEQQQAIRFAFAGMHVFYKIYKYCEQHSGKDKQSCRKRFDIIGGSGDEQKRAYGKIQYGDAAEVCVEPMMLSVLYAVRVKKDRHRDELNHHEAQCA